MEGARFDTIARALATSGSRRQVLGALVGGAVAGLFSRHPIQAHAVSEECGLVDPGATVFGDDFEGGDLSTRWDDVQGLVVEFPVEGPSFLSENPIVPGDTHIVRAMSAEGAPKYARTGLGTTDGFDDLHFRVRVKVIDRPVSEWLDLLSFRTVNDEPILGLGIDDLGQLRYRNDTQGFAEGVGSPTVQQSVEVQRRMWHTVQVHLRLADGNGRVEVWYDGTQVPGLSNDEAFGIAPIGRIQLGDSAPRETAYDVAFDEVVVATGFFRDCGTKELCCAGICVLSDNDNCVSCGRVCPGPLPNANVTCDSVGCGYSCHMDFKDCDDNWENGCEGEPHRSDDSCGPSCCGPSCQPPEPCPPGESCTSCGRCCPSGDPCPCPILTIHVRYI